MVVGMDRVGISGSKASEIEWFSSPLILLANRVHLVVVTSCIDNSSVCIYFNASRLKEGSIYADSANIFIPIDRTKVP